MHYLWTLYTTCYCGSWCGHELLTFAYTWSLNGQQKQGVSGILNEVFMWAKYYS
jgi:hypothetical protein